MATKVELLIQDAYRFAELLGEGEIANASELNDGLRWLNIAIREINIDSDERPLLNEEEFTLVAGNEEIELPDWVSILKLQYLLGNTFLDIRILDLNEYLNGARIQSTSGIPVIAYPKRNDTGITLKLFFKPSTDYRMTVHGYKNIPQLATSDTLTGVLDFIQDYLLFKLASDLRTFYNQQPMPFLERRVEMYRERFRQISERRLDSRVLTPRQGGGTQRSHSSMAAFNIGRGWSPY